jgi:hypothetical protein
MTTVNQSELQTAVSVDELLALGSNPALTDLLFYVRDGSQASENGKHRKVAGDVLRTLLASSGGREFFPTIANNTSDANNDINFGASRLWVSNGSAELLIDFAARTKQLDAAYAAGDNQGGLDTGSKANSTWYYLWAIYNATSGVADYLFSASRTSPTMPSGFAYRRLVGAVLTNGSGSIRGFRNYGRGYIWTAEFITDLAIEGASAAAYANPTNLAVSAPRIEGSIYYGELIAGSAVGNVARVFSHSGSRSVTIEIAAVNRNFFAPIRAVVNGSGQLQLQATSTTWPSLYVIGTGYEINL